ncbi:MAG: NB-ARC domain-containing protein, partial [Pseudomonadota bacterium]
VKYYQKKYELDDAAGHRSAINQVIDEAIGRLRILDVNAANLIEWRFVDGKSVEELIDQTKGETRHVFMPKQRAALKQLATIIWNLEIAYRENERRRISQSIPQRIHSKLVGLDELVDTVVDYLVDEEYSDPVIIHGIGGIGKTTLAETAVLELIQQLAFTQVAWVTIQNSTLPNGTLDLDGVIEPIIEQMGREQWLTFDGKKQKQQLTYTFNNQPYLVVLDNNESPIDEALLAQLQEWSGRSRFLLTSRVIPEDGIGYAPVPVDQLSLENTIDLIRAQAERERVDATALLSDENIQSIYEVVGGNPLAIKLVVGLTRKRPLNTILADITKATSKKIEALYTHIYWEAWRALSDNGRSLLQLMFSADLTECALRHPYFRFVFTPFQIFPAVSLHATKDLDLEVPFDPHCQSIGLFQGSNDQAIININNHHNNIAISNFQNE